jgi:hypothetical protein
VDREVGLQVANYQYVAVIAHINSLIKPES